MNEELMNDLINAISNLSDKIDSLNDILSEFKLEYQEETGWKVDGLTEAINTLSETIKES